jgi:hypothetical protein
MPIQEQLYPDTASRLGFVGRRLIGEHILTEKEIFSGIIFPDTIAVCPDFRHTVSPGIALAHTLMFPNTTWINNLLVAGRCYSSDLVANDLLAPIQFCMAMGQASGTAAALAVKHNIGTREVNYRVLQEYLVKQGVPLPVP